LSSYKTHVLIGGVGGLALDRALMLTPAAAVLGLPSGGGAAIGMTVGLVAVSGVLATIPDLDTPQAYASQRMLGLFGATGMCLGIALALLIVAGELSWSMWSLDTLIRSGLPVVIGAVGGGVLGLALGWLFPRGIRAISGGHRHGTHSLVFSVPAFLIGALLFALPWAIEMLWNLGVGVWAWGFYGGGLFLMALGWGQWLHLCGDVVTVSGVPLFYPLSHKDYRVLPKSIARIGEILVGLAATGVGALLLYFGW